MNCETHVAHLGALERLIADLGITKADVDAIPDNMVPHVAPLRANLTDVQKSIGECERDAQAVVAHLRETEQAALKAIALCKLKYLIDIKTAELAAAEREARAPLRDLGA